MTENLSDENREQIDEILERSTDGQESRSRRAQIASAVGGEVVRGRR